jgi:hypothetical protein
LTANAQEIRIRVESSIPQHLEQCIWGDLPFLKDHVESRSIAFTWNHAKAVFLMCRV